jgi:hypothetical protein
VLLFGLGAIGSLLIVWVDASFIPTIPKLLGCLAMLGVALLIIRAACEVNKS